MKIWIVSSRPYLEEFEKMASYWPEGTDCVISPIYNYGLNISSVKNFFKDFKRINPDLIVTDHGYIGYFPIRMYSYLKRKRVKIFFFLRGNFWLEKKNYAKNISNYEIEYFDIKIDAPKNDILNFTDAHEKHIAYFQKLKINDKSNYDFRNIWPGVYFVNYKGKQIRLKPTKSEKIDTEGLKIEIIKIKHSIPKGSKETLKEHGRIYLQKLGWDLAFNYSHQIIAVCNYLKINAPKKLESKTVICPIGIDTSLKRQGQNLKLKHPAVVIIQNHQIKEKSIAMVSFKKIVEAFPNVNFYISEGLPENRNNHNYQNVVEALGGLKNVSFREINAHNKMEYLEESDLYILRSGLDCTPATIIEASIAKKPTLASKVGGVPEMIQAGRTGWTINNSDQEKWIEKIDFLISNPAEAKKMGQEARKFAEENYAMEKVANNFYKIITEGK